MSGLEKIDKSTLPKHVAIVMDGNGRWAKSRGKDRIFGHTEGINSVRAVVEAARELGLSYLTLYVFSTENWNRPQKEVNALMRLMTETIDRETDDLIKNGVRGLVVGDLDRLEKDIQDKVQQFMHNTAQGNELNLVLALSYSSRWEIMEAVKSIAKGLSEGRILEQELDEDCFSKHLCTAGSLCSGFPPDRLVGLSVKRVYAITLYDRLPIGLNAPLGASVTLLEATTPVKLPTKQCPHKITRVRIQITKGPYFKDDSTSTSVPDSQSPAYPTHLIPKLNVKLQ
jgi:undecaprenyl diphosphate synthase